jgi:hypothetical protein
MNHKALIFLHIPKTAGTTLNRIIEWQYSPLSIFTVDPHGIRATPERFKTLSEERGASYGSCADIWSMAFMNFSPKALPISQCFVTQWPGYYRLTHLFCGGRLIPCTAS